MITLKYSHHSKAWSGDDNIIRRIMFDEHMIRLCAYSVRKAEQKALCKKHCIEARKKRKSLSNRSVYSYAIGAQPERENLTDWNFSERYKDISD